MLVEDFQGIVGEFHGISTYSNPSMITINAYEVDGVKKKSVKLDKSLDYEGRAIPI
jgi:hypothetical protein